MVAELAGLGCEELLQRLVKNAKVCDPESKAGVLRRGVDDDQRLALSAPEDARIVETRDVGEGRP